MIQADFALFEAGIQLYQNPSCRHPDACGTELYCSLNPLQYVSLERKNTLQIPESVTANPGSN